MYESTLTTDLQCFCILVHNNCVVDSKGKRVLLQIISVIVGRMNVKECLTSKGRQVYTAQE